MQRLLAFTLHATAAGIMTWGWCNAGIIGERLPKEYPKANNLLFLTNQGLLISWLCMVVSLFCDIPISHKDAAIRETKRVLLMISIQLEFVISTIYWTLLLLFPHLILPRTSGDPSAELLFLPLELDLALHASPILALLIDFFVFQPKFSKTYVRTVAPVAFVAFSVWYASFVEYCATFNKFFPYPFLTHSPFSGRVLIYIVITGIELGFFWTLNGLHP